MPQHDGSGAQRELPRIAVLTSSVTPYRVAVFEALAQRSDLTVIFGSVSGTRAMPWSEAELPFSHRFVDGWAIRRSTPDATDFYPSPRVLRALARARPQV